MNVRILIKAELVHNAVTKFTKAIPMYGMQAKP